MGHILTVLEFGWRYLSRYWPRLTAALALSVVFGLSNAGFVWGTRTLLERLQTPTETAPAIVSRPGEATSQRSGGDDPVGNRLVELQGELHEAVDSWLPRAGEKMGWRQILAALLLLPMIVLIRGLTDYLSSYCLGWVTERVINDLRLDVLEKLSGLSLGFFSQSRTGDLLTRINTDTLALQRCLQLGAADLFKESLTFIAVLGVLFWTNWELTALSMISLPLLLGPMLVLGRKARRASRASIQAQVEQSNQLVDMLAGMRIIKAYSLESQQMERYRELCGKLLRHGMKGVQAREMVNPAIEVISTLWLGGLLLYLYMSRGGVSDFVYLITGLIWVYIAIRKLGVVHVLFEQASVGVERLAEVLCQQPSVRETASPKPLTDFREEVRFHGVGFAYEPGRPALSGIDLVLRRGMRLGVAGASGSGKSTIVNLLFRFYDPTEGHITIDGVDIRDVALDDLRRLMSLVSQEVILFDRTVAENIALGRVGATQEEIEAAARAAAAHEFIQRLPEGYATRIGERGVTLSGGQRQRLALARAFVRNAPILVLDEATAALDSHSEAEVQAAIERLEEDRTVLCVAHRLSTLASMDEIVVIQEGGIVERGTFTGLLERGGPFAEMAARQGIGLAASRR